MFVILTRWCPAHHPPCTQWKNKLWNRTPWQLACPSSSILGLFPLGGRSPLCSFLAPPRSGLSCGALHTASLVTVCIAWMIVHRSRIHLSWNAQSLCVLGCSFALLAWIVCLDCYDLLRTPTHRPPSAVIIFALFHSAWLSEVDFEWVGKPTIPKITQLACCCYLPYSCAEHSLNNTVC